MKLQKSRILMLILSLALVLNLAVFGAAPSAIEEKAQTLVADYGAASLSYALMEDGEIIMTGQAGQYQKGGDTPLTADTMYGIGSTSKMFTTAVILKLVDLGEVDLDQPVTTYVPEFTMQDPRYKDITVRMLLNHSSGLMGSTYANGFLWEDDDTQAHDTLLSDLKSQRLKADPGAYSVYCNDGFTLAEIVAEKVTGKSFTSLLHEYITEPLGMENTKTVQDGFDYSRLARGYSPLNPEAMTPSETVGVIGTGGVYSTSEDLCRFGQIFTGESDILSESAIKASMEKEYLKGQWHEFDYNIIGYGLGWDTVEAYPFSQYDIQALCKGGDIITFHCSLIVLPEYNMTAAVVSSGLNSMYNEVLASEMLLARLLEKGEIKERKKDVAIIAPEPQPLDEKTRALNGLYGASLGLYTVDFDEDGALLLANAYTPDNAQPYLHGGDGVFYLKDGGEKLFFIEQEGRTYLMQEALTELAGIGALYSGAYVAQKLPDYTMPEDAAAAWTARNGIPYLSVTDKHTSLSYAFSLPMLNVLTDESFGGYLVSNQVTGPQSAKAIVQIPMQNGRDMFDYTITSGSPEYFLMGDNAYVSMTSLLPIYGGSKSYCTIQPDGYTRWYTVDESLVGKTVSIDCMEGSGFILFDANGMTVNQSAASGQYRFTLASAGYIAFAGGAGDRFVITIE